MTIATGWNLSTQFASILKDSGVSTTHARHGAFENKLFLSIGIFPLSRASVLKPVCLKVYTETFRKLSYCFGSFLQCYLNPVKSKLKFLIAETWLTPGKKYKILPFAINNLIYFSSFTCTDGTAVCLQFKELKIL